MVRQQNAADGDRPHYYSQYWINVALGKPTGVQEETAEQGLISPSALLETLESEPELPPPPAPAPRVEPKAPKRAPEKKPEPARLSSLADLADIAELMKNSAAMDDDVVPNIEANSAAAGAALPPIVTDFDLTENAEEPVAEVEEAEGIEPYEAFDEFEFDDEDEEEDEWGGRRPGKGGGGPKKPTKPQRPPRRRDF